MVRHGIFITKLRFNFLIKLIHKITTTHLLFNKFMSCNINDFNQNFVLHIKIHLCIQIILF